MAEVLGEHLRDHPEEVAAYGRSVGKIFNDVSEQMKAENGGSFSYHSAPGDHGSPSSQESMAAATRPAVVLPLQ